MSNCLIKHQEAPASPSFWDNTTTETKLMCVKNKIKTSWKSSQNTQEEIYMKKRKYAVDTLEFWKKYTQSKKKMIG